MSDNLTLDPHQVYSKTVSEQLTTLIQGAIDNHQGQLPFDEFMNLALYAPQLGYYQSGKTILGAQGDFITAPMISPLFSQCLAEQCFDVLKHIPNGQILEIGAGTGQMATDILKHLEEIDALPPQYSILETSAYLKSLQQETIQQQIPHLYDKVSWLSSLPNKPFSGIVLGNEVLDAMPFKRFHFQSEQLHEIYVSYDNQGFKAILGTPTPQLKQQCDQLSLPALSEPYQSEINLYLKPWLKSIDQILHHGVLLLLDYGYRQEEYYHPQRTQGTMMCFYQQHQHDSPFIHVGQQDMTAHVNFTAVSKSGVELNLETLGYCPQFAFLIACGLETFMQQQMLSADLKTQTLLSQSMNKLCSPAEMGEIFKVIAMGKHFHQPLKGFQLINQKDVLS